MDILSYKALNEKENSSFVLREAPERILQIGEGNFLRGFVDYFVDLSNEKANFNGKVIVAQPIKNGLADMINEQDGLYTVYLRGIDNGKKYEEKRLISCISRAINPYEDYQSFLDCAKLESLKYIVSNTTEAGIAFDENCKFDDAPPSAFPAKLARVLYERYSSLGAEAPGFIILSCELIDNNGAALKQCVNDYIKLWNLDEGFYNWVQGKNLFCSTLVDRIITGYPRNEADQLNEDNGYIDKLMVTGENFGLWVIEGPEWLEDELPFKRAGLPVIVTGDHTPYKQRKVRILNGAHTSMSPVSFLAGKNIVRECVEDQNIRSYMDQAIYKEIIPTLTLPVEELKDFADSVITRFQNPFIDHQLLAITLNSIAKWRARVLPAVKEYFAKFNEVPKCLSFGFASLLKLYRAEKMDGEKMFGLRGSQPYQIMDDPQVLKQFYDIRNLDTEAYVKTICENLEFWGEDLTQIPGFVEIVIKYLSQFEANGVLASLEKLLSEL